VVSVWNPKAKKWISGRKNWRIKLEGIFNEDDKVIWFHCASLGEFEQGRSLIEKVRIQCPDHKILLTFFSPSGFEKRKDYKLVDHVCYLPLDTSRNAHAFVHMIPLEKVFFIKYEFWYHFLKNIRAKNVPLYLASGNFQKSHIFFKKYGSWYRKILGSFTQIFVQDMESSELLKKYGFNNFIVSGDTRFDRVKQISVRNTEMKEVSSFAGDSPILIAGSTWEKDELLIREAYLSLKGKCKWIIAPHEPSEQHIHRLKRWFPEALLFSELKKDFEDEIDVIIVNTIGHLSSLYHYGLIAYIGGGFGKGIHNILEASAAGLPVLFGPNYNRFREALDLKSAGAAYVVEHSDDLIRQILLMLNDQGLLKTRSQIAENYTISNTGATDKIVDFVFKS